jgi:hypothetical protein
MEKLKNMGSLKLRAFFTRRIVIGLALLTTLLGHIWLFSYSLAEVSSTHQKIYKLRLKIVADAGTSASNIEEESIITRSPRRGELEALQKREDQFNSLTGIVIITLAIWPVALLLGGILFIVRFWRSKGLSPAEQKARRERLLLVGVLSTAFALVALILAWRYVSAGLFFTDRFYQWLATAFLVIVVGIWLVELIWKFVSLGRFRSHLYSIQISSRRIPQALVLATVAWTGLADLDQFLKLDRQELFRIVERSSADHEFFAYGVFLNRLKFGALGAQALIWSSIVFSLGAAAMDYLRLPISSAGTLAASKIPPPAASSTTTATTNTTSTSPSESNLLGAEALRDEVARLATLLAEASARTNGKPRVNDRTKQVQGVVLNRSLEIRERLLTEVHSLTQRGNLNLIIGSATSLIAGATLWMLVAKVPEAITTTGFLVYYVPRLSVAIFIEAFSFFFLKLYKAGLADIKYYQNELTNLESRFLALELASLTPQSDDTMSSLLLDLSRVDRNVILKVGDSTVEIEKMKLEQQDLRSIVEGVLKIVPNLTHKTS